ncbi:MAG: hypothetical protein H3C68_01475 [Deltaproteobacteria bacterium]|nr:hypothetical protein [Deltaproteobacteria bacterium]MBZ0219075.1 hypothetical protein [Deltaproteobacteria bacterium]
MGFFSKVVKEVKRVAKDVKREVTNATTYIPPLAVMAPIGGKKQRENAMKGLAMGATIATGGMASGVLKTAAPVNTSAALDPVTGEFTGAYMSAPGGGGSSFFKSLATTATQLLPQSGSQTQAVSMDYPLAYQYVPQPVAEAVPNPLSFQYVPPPNSGQPAQGGGFSTNHLLLIGIGALLVIGVIRNG